MVYDAVANATKVRIVDVGGAEVSPDGTPTTIAQAAVSVGLAETLLSAASVNKRRVSIHNLGTVPIYIGATGVTTANGFPLAAGAAKVVETEAAVYAISGTAAQDARVLTESV